MAGLLSTLLACRTGELTRSHAQQILTRMVRYFPGPLHLRLKVPEPYLGSALPTCAETTGLIEKRGWSYAIKSSGKSLISQVKHNSDLDGATVWLKEPLQVVIVEVTGITAASGGQGRMVDYRAKFVDVPPIQSPAIRACLVPNERNYRALFRLYDDGWRIEDAGMRVEN